MDLQDKLALMIAEFGAHPNYVTVDIRWLDTGEIWRDQTIAIFDPTPRQQEGLDGDDQILFYVSKTNELLRLFHPSHEDFEIIDITDIY